MVFKKIIFQNRYVELETPPPFMAKTILNFHFDYLKTRLIKCDNAKAQTIYNLHLSFAALVSSSEIFLLAVLVLQ